ncbi:MAG: cell division protein FtsX, partial [Chitinophagaceae bacterium]
MAQSGKGSGKRGKPSYFMSILGVTLVLFLLGIIGWLVINANKLGSYFKENVEVGAYLRGDVNANDSAALMSYISAKPYVREIEFVTKEAAKKKYLGDGNENWDKVIAGTPALSSLDNRLRVLNKYEGLSQVLTIASPALEESANMENAVYLAKLGND